MKDHLITFETAVLAKQKGFKLDQLYYYKKKPLTQSLLQKWLREVYGIHIQPFYHPNTISTREIKPEVEIVRVFAKDGITKSILPPSLKGKEYNTYEEALEIGLQAALKLINLKP